MSKRMLFVFNPLAGKEQIKNKLMDIIRIFSTAGYEVTIYPTKGHEDAVYITREKAEEYDLVVCSGGDGTMNEVAAGIMSGRKRPPIGYIPAGSTNDFASSLGIPRDMLEAAKIAVSGNEFACDVGAFNASTFIYIAAFGIFTDVSYETPQEMKNVLGHMAYVLEGMKRIPSLRTYKLTVSCNGSVIEDEFLFGMITNSTSVGGLKRITGKYVELDDGLFEVTLIRKPRNAMDVNMIATSLLSGEIDTECIYYAKADEVKIKAEEEVPWTLDGEFGGGHKDVIIRNIPEAIRIIVPGEI